jgi:hypothetical protein
MAVEQRFDLRASATDSRGAHHDLGPHLLAFPGACRQPVERHLVEGRYSPKRAADEMQLVLDNELRRRQRTITVEPCANSAWVCRAVETPLVLAIDMAEESARLSNPGKASEFVDGSDDEGWQTAIDHLING